MKKKIFLLVLAALFWIFSGCVPPYEPQITIEAKVTNLTTEKYKSVGTKGLGNPKRGDFRKVTFKLHVRHLPEFQLTVNTPEERWRKNINQVDEQTRYWFGSGSERNDDEIVEYYDEFVIYTKGLSDQDIKDAYKDTVYILTWISREGVKEEKVYSVSEVMEFQE